MIDTREPEVRARLQEALGAARLAEEVASGGPYADAAALTAAADAAVARATAADLDEAARAHPPLGDAPDAEDLTPAEQAGLEPTEEGPAASIVRGGTVYEDRFGRPLLIRTAGRSAEEVLEELQRRLKNDPEDEAEEARRELRELVARRLQGAFGA